MIRQIALDTETTGMNKFGIHYEGHRIIEIGAVEIIDRHLTGNQFHVYLNPSRSVDIEAFRIHGINDKFLINQPFFSDIVKEFLLFIRGSELIIHNASFDLGFLNYELQNFNSNLKKIESYCTVIDSLKLARKLFPGQRNNLNALCERYYINNSKRDLHNALVDAKLLANVFLSMTGGQRKMKFMEQNFMNTSKITIDDKKQLSNTYIKKSLKVVVANRLERLEHEKYLNVIENISKHCLWKRCN